MANAGHGQGALPNGTSQLSHRPQTPAYTVGNQFVTQFYLVLHNTPDNLYRFYTDESTVTHSDCGTDTELPSSVTVTTQKDIRSRMQAMSFDEARTEIWSVDSQYSSQNGVLVLVTGSMECKGKKKRDFIQSFFLATQEKGYYVLNDTLRYLSDRSSGASAPPKDTFNSQNNPLLQASLYHPPQPAQIQPYYPQTQQTQQQSHHAAYASSYQNPSANHVSQASHQPIRQNAVTPPAASFSQPKPQPSPQPAAPVEPPAHAESKQVEPTVLKLNPQPTETPAPAPVPTPPANTPKEEVPKPAPIQAEKKAEKKSESAANSVLTKSTQTAATETKPQEKEQSADPPAPKTYADRLRMNAASQKAAPQSRNNTSNQQPRPQQTPATQQRPSTSPPVPPIHQEPPTVEPSTVQEPQYNGPTEVSTSEKEEEIVTTSIFARNLPEDTTAEKILEVFSQFGTVKNGLQGVNLKQQKTKGGGDFVFVEFEEQASMQAAITAKVEIDGKPISVVERRPFVSRGYAPRGGRGDGRGYRGRGEGRGRGRDRPHTTGGRSEAREPRPEGGRGGRGYEGRGHEGRGQEGGRGRGDRGRGRYGGRGGPPPQNPPVPRQQVAAA